MMRDILKGFNKGEQERNGKEERGKGEEGERGKVWGRLQDQRGSGQKNGEEIN